MKRKFNSETGAADQFFVRNYDQLALLESPVRQEIVDAVAARGPCSIADVAAQLGRTPESLYFHVNKLTTAGLLRRAGTNRRGRRDEALYVTPGRRMMLAIAPMTSRRRDALIKIVKGSLRCAVRDVERGMRAPGAVMSGPSRTVYSARVQGWLTDSARARLARLFDEIEQLMAEGQPTPDAELCSVSLTLAPCKLRSSPRSRSPVNNKEPA